MPAKNFVVAIELGSTKIKGIAGQKKPDGTIAVLAVVSEDASQCIRNGVVYNIDKTAQCISSIVQRLKTQLKAGIKHVYVGVGGQSIHSELNVIVREINNNIPVTQNLVVEMMDQNRSMEYSDMEILDVEVQEYQADSLSQTEPVGILCSRLNGNFLNILQSKRHFQKLNSCFGIAKVKIAEMYLAPFALADAVLTPVEKRSGCVLVDLGADTTTVMVYYKSILRHIAVIPLGGNNITRDLCTLLQLEEDEAEQLKRRYASAYTPAEAIDTSLKYDIGIDRKCDSSRVIDIVEARMEEIMSNVCYQIPRAYAEKILGGIILTGGGSNLKNIEEAFRKYVHIEKVRRADFVTYTINANNAEINAHDGSMNTLLGLLAKGDQNCYCAPVEPQSADETGEVVATETGEQTQPRDINTLQRGVIPTAEEMERKRIIDEQNKQKVVATSTDVNAAAETPSEQPQKTTANKFMKWIKNMFEPGE